MLDVNPNLLASTNNIIDEIVYLKEKDFISISSVFIWIFFNVSEWKILSKILINGRLKLEVNSWKIKANVRRKGI